VILVDTSVWIDYFAGHELPHVDKLEQFIRENRNLALCGIVLTEILQGIADERAYRRVRRHLRSLVMLPIPEAAFVRAADVYRELRKLGVTIRKMNDCIIAATVLHHRCELLHNDRDFEPIAERFSVRFA
jgi:predicted nucleic acid-binding protein